MKDNSKFFVSKYEKEADIIVKAIEKELKNSDTFAFYIHSSLQDNREKFALYGFKYEYKYGEDILEYTEPNSPNKDKIPSKEKSNKVETPDNSGKGFKAKMPFEAVSVNKPLNMSGVSLDGQAHRKKLSVKKRLKREVLDGYRSFQRAASGKLGSLKMSASGLTTDLASKANMFSRFR